MEELTENLEDCFIEYSRKKDANASDVNEGLFCDPCEGNNETNEAENYCIDCNEFLCNGCAKVHRKSKMLLHHKMLDGSKMPKKKLVLSGDDVCSRHDGKPLEYFCKNHAGFYCAPCVTLEHRNCSLKYLTEEAKGFSDSEDYRAITWRIQKVNWRISQTIDKIQLCRDEAKSHHLKYLQEIQEFRNNIETIVQAVEDTGKEQANVIQKRDVEAFDSFSKRSNKMTKETDRIMEEFESLTACKQQSRLFIAAKKAETKLDTIDTELEEINSKARVSRYNFLGKEIMKMRVESWSNLEVLKRDDKPTSPEERYKNEYEIGSDGETVERLSVESWGKIEVLEWGDKPASSEKLYKDEHEERCDGETVGWLSRFAVCKDQSDFSVYGGQYKSESCATGSNLEVDSNATVSSCKFKERKQEGAQSESLIDLSGIDFRRRKRMERLREFFLCPDNQ